MAFQGAFHGESEARKEVRSPSRSVAPWLAVLVLLIYAWNVHTFAFVGDDAFISFRYARHLVDGHGLVFNPGERVEGYSNFAWVLLVALGTWFGWAPEAWTPVAGAVAGAGVLAVVASMGARLHGWRDPWIWLAPAALALSRTFTAWSTGGLETQLFSFLIVGATYLFLRERDEPPRSSVGSSYAFGLASLTRPEGPLFFGCALLAFALEVWRGRRSARALARWVLPFAVLVGAHVLWRNAYYGDWVPNTFHAKVNGAWWEQGGRFLGLFVREYGLAWTLPLAAVGVVSTWRRADGRLEIVVLPTLLFAAYLGYVGGGHMGFRLLVPVLPFLYLLMAGGGRALARATGGPARTVVAFLVWISVLGTTVHGTRNPLPRRTSGGIAHSLALRKFAGMRIEQGRTLAGWIESGDLPRDLRVETGAIGALPYYTGWYVLDKRGLTDRDVARSPLEARGFVGHEHSTTLAGIRTRGIEVVAISHELLLRGEASAVDRRLEALRHRLELANEAAVADEDRLRFESWRLPAEDELQVFVFGTHLTPAAVDARLEGLTRYPTSE